MTNNFFPENHAVYEIIKKNVAEPEQTTDNNLIWHMSVACSITKTARTHTYVMLIAFPRQQWSRESASMLRYSASPVLFRFTTSCKKCGDYKNIYWQY